MHAPAAGVAARESRVGDRHREILRRAVPALRRPAARSARLHRMVFAAARGQQNRLRGGPGRGPGERGLRLGALGTQADQRQHGNSAGHLHRRESRLVQELAVPPAAFASRRGVADLARVPVPGAVQARQAGARGRDVRRQGRLHPDREILFHADRRAEIAGAHLHRSRRQEPDDPDRLCELHRQAGRMDGVRASPPLGEADLDDLGDAHA